MAAGTRSSAKLVIDGMIAKTMTWMANMLRKVNGRPIASESQPQNNLPILLKIEMTLTMIAAVNGRTPVNFCANGEATEITAAPAVTFNASMSQRRYHLGRRNASERVYSRTERSVRCLTEGVQPAGAYPSGAVRKNCATI